MPPKVTITDSHIPEFDLFSTPSFHRLHYKWDNDGDLPRQTLHEVVEASAHFYATHGDLMNWRKLLRTRMVEGTSLSDAQLLWNTNMKRAIGIVEEWQEELVAIPRWIEARRYGEDA
ncbi:MAG: hypothetical protein Q9208_001411 [Pyrenodesmia sp. 3 TL-2023]